MPLDLQTISDRMEIDDLLVRYARAIDTKNFAELENLFIPDGEYDAGSLGHPTSAKAIRA
ncbi:MAG: nuclear transport factor 2 family protein, partial [Actinobacteria bacterium]|nr:nuclear transport factor 2 family protein [Actinomycetota bacterium]